MLVLCVLSAEALLLVEVWAELDSTAKALAEAVALGLPPLPLPRTLLLAAALKVGAAEALPPPPPPPLLLVTCALTLAASLALPEALPL